MVAEQLRAGWQPATCNFILKCFLTASGLQLDVLCLCARINLVTTVAIIRSSSSIFTIILRLLEGVSLLTCCMHDVPRIHSQ